MKDLYKKVLNDPDNHDGVVTPRARHPGVWSQVGLRKHHYKATGSDGIPVELFKIL